MPTKSDNHHDEEELDPLDNEETTKEENPEEDQDDFEKEDTTPSKPEPQEEEASSFRGNEAEDEGKVLESSDEEPIDLDESDGVRDKGLKEESPYPFKINFNQEEEESKSSFRRMNEVEKGKEHTLDDLASEGSDLPPGVEPSKPKSFDMNMEDDFKRDIPHIGSNLNGTNIYTNRRSSSSRRKFNTLLLFIIAILVIGGSIYLLKAKFLSKNSNISYNAPVASSTPEPTPIPTPVFDRTPFHLRILNGSGKTGLAASVSAKLKDLGYQVDKIGNATNSAFPQTEIRVKDNDASLSAQLVQDLSPDFSATSSTPLKSSDTADAEIILGLK